MKIGIIKEKKEGFVIVSIILAICVVSTFLFPLDLETKIVIFVMFIISYLIIILCFLISMEWYILEKDSIIVKNVFGTVNKVNYKDVKFVYVKKMPVFTRDKGIPCLLFNDGRKERSFFTGNNIDNHKKYVVRIPYTQEVVEYLKTNNIKLNNNSIFKSIIDE